ncbi:hypothetical protein F5Y15DRAFT_82927 [Xylariaceae sp. FL0016]|nr:hypothetical protein F5Y15DRAFT_82927 [Xylariaceae sp. FL0016]
MPYMHSQKLEFLAMRRQRGLGKITDLEYCRTNDRKDLGADIEVTLDEFCNPALDPEVMRMRNVDQVLTRYGRRKISSMAPRSPHTDSLPLQLRLFTVPQLWCWKIGTKLIFSCAKSANEDLKLLRSEPKTIDPDQYIGRLISHFVDTLDRPQMLGLSEPIFSVFSKSIAAVAEDVNKYTRRASFDDISIRKETQFLHEINDIREEIAMIKTVLFQQEEVWKEFMVNTWPEYWPDGEDKRFRPPVCDDLAETEIWREIAKPQTQFPKFKKRFEKLDEDAERVERNILIKLDLKQKHATMKETHTATVMSAAVVGFTIITIIFAPLSFLTSLFALPIKQFRQEADGNYSSNYIGKWMATGEVASLIVTLLAIWVALECFLGLHITRRLRDLFPANDPRSMPEIDPYVRSAVGKLPKMPAPPRNSTKTEVYTPNEQPNHHSFRERVFWSRGRKAPSADVENGP